MGHAGPAGSMCGYPVLAAVAASLSPLLMPLPRSAFLESAALASALFHAPALASAFLESAAFTSALFHAPALACAFTSAFLESAALACAFTSAFLESAALACAFTSAFLESAALACAFTSAFLEPPAFTFTCAFTCAFTSAFATIVAVRPVALTATAPASGAGLCRILRDLCGAAGRIDRLRLHRHRDDEGRRRDSASSQCFLEHEYHFRRLRDCHRGTPDTRSANRSIEPWIQTLILTLEVTKGPVTQKCANNRFPQQKTNAIGGVVGPFPRADNPFTWVPGFLPHR
ncbi:hypothetical protein IL992_43065 [Microbispora sp. NEAU-D428]|uniref:hypothetical protein n=1 Tax=Microbispora sitophila TaxID=2771537 RepID=UPI00186812A6|nr:hypothetical protein [Microbispora sitophila]MBE3015895.1 hypothetical protein [Microbispora sitophila]